MPLDVRHALLAVLVALPWLWPFTFGPLAATVPWLASMAVAAVLLVAWPAQAPAGGARVAAAGWLAAAVFSSVLALLQYFDLEAPLYPWVNIAQPGQAFGNLRQPNQLASLLVIGALSLRWWLQQAVSGHGRSVALAAVTGALLMAGLAATASRVGLVELLVLGAAALWWARAPGRGRRVALGGIVVAVGLYALAALLLPALLQASEGVAGRDMLDRLQHAESTCGSRLILWRNVLHLIAQQPLWGWGWGELDYAHYTTLHHGPRFCHILDNAHNLPLHLAVELGVPAALLACALAAWAVWRGRPWAERNATRQLAWGVLAVIGIHSMVEYPLWYGPFQIAAALSVWLLWATRRGSGEAGAAQPMVHSRRAARGALAALTLLALAYAGWDYHRISQIYLARDQRAAPYQDDAMAQARRSRLYADVVRFAEVTTRPATRDNAAWLLPAALQALHFSPEPRVAIQVIESAALLAQDDVALAHLARFRAAFPKQHAEWAQANAQMLQGARALAAGAASAPPGSDGNSKK